MLYVHQQAKGSSLLIETHLSELAYLHCLVEYSQMLAGQELLPVSAKPNELLVFLHLVEVFCQEIPCWLWMPLAPRRQCQNPWQWQI